MNWLQLLQAKLRSYIEKNTSSEPYIPLTGELGVTQEDTWRNRLVAEGGPGWCRIYSKQIKVTGCNSDL